MKDFRKLDVWHKSHSMALEVYRISASFPGEERYGITSQLRRACVSIPTNIAEGCGRNSDGELARFAEIAMGSSSEVEYLLLLSRDLNYLNLEAFERLAAGVTEVKRMLAGLITKVNADRRMLKAEGSL